MTGAVVNLALARALRNEREQRIADQQATRQEALTPEDVRALLEAAYAENPERFTGPKGEQGKRGPAPTVAQIAAAAHEWLAANAEALRGEDGKAPDTETLTALIEALIDADPERFRGLQGDIGAAPDHQWKGTKLRFQKPDGNWGRWVDLQGAAGVTRVVSVAGGSSLTEQRVIELIEASMPTPEIEYPRIVTTVNTAGANVLHSPPEGAAIRVRRIKCTPDPDSVETPMLTLRLGDKLVQRGPVLYGADFVEGAIGAALILDLQSAAEIGVTIIYEEFTP